MTQHLHGQVPTASLTEADYETLLVHLGEQLAAQITRGNGCAPEGEDAKQATGALVSTFGTSEDQTILDWLKAAAAWACVSSDGMVGI